MTISSAQLSSCWNLLTRDLRVGLVALKGLLWDAPLHLIGLLFWRSRKFASGGAMLRLLPKFSRVRPRHGLDSERFQHRSMPLLLAHL